MDSLDQIAAGRVFLVGWHSDETGVFLNLRDVQVEPHKSVLFWINESIFRLETLEVSLQKIDFQLLVEFDQF
jgi:hypothetical protein